MLKGLPAWPELFVPVGALVAALSSESAAFAELAAQLPAHRLLFVRLSLDYAAASALVARVPAYAGAASVPAGVPE